MARISAFVSIGLVMATAMCVYADWDYMLFEEQWAPGACWQGGKTLVNIQGLGRHHHSGSKECDIPAVASDGFTIHGSWPTKDGSEGPNYCNDSWPFSPAPIQDLVSDLDVFWPSFYGPNAEFWSHEWDKHGVCAAQLPALNSEHKFFDFVLELRKKHDFKQYFADGGVLPSQDRTYSFTNMTKTVQNAIGVAPFLSCQQGGDGAQYLSALAVCIGRTLTITECPVEVFSERGHCQSDTPITYLPHKAM
eukprot:scpid86036/ scgid19476/ Ribonuclease Oy